jgi:hypothetical protein
MFDRGGRVVARLDTYPLQQRRHCQRIEHQP